MPKRRRKRRVNRHKKIIDEFEIRPGMVMQLFHSSMRMPPVLKGLPDLNIQWCGVNYWVEIKPLYNKSRRDIMKPPQWLWYHERLEAGLWGEYNRYGIVTDTSEMNDFVVGTEHIYIPDWHRERYEVWKNDILP